MRLSSGLLYAAMVVVLAAAGFVCFRPGTPGNDLTGKLPPPAKDLTPPDGEDGLRKAVLAGGCFWCTEAVFEQLRGVESVVSGYAGGSAADADYYKVATGRTGHAEAIEVTYDPRVITYGELLHVFFDVAHNPTQEDRQWPDVGRQYRSAIFYADEEQKQVAEAYIAQLNAAGIFAAPIATALEPLGRFYPAEGHHQDYARRCPSDPYVREFGVPKVEKVRRHFSDKIRE